MVENSDTFRFFLPMDIDIEKGDPDEPEKRVIKGYASTGAKDAEDENVVQKGLDLSYFLARGFLNYDHQKHMIVGWPTKSEINKKGMYLEGRLLLEQPMAEHLWTTAKALRKSGAPRKLGLSIEGKVIEREGRTIKRARVFNVAITPHPVNPEATFDVVCKAMWPCECHGDACCKDEIWRALDAGHAVALEDQTGGGSLRRESVDRDVKVTTFRPDRSLCQTLTGEAKQMCERIAAQKSVDMEDAVSFLQLAAGLGRSDAFALAKQLERAA